MSEFISLREFLLLRDPFDGRPLNIDKLDWRLPRSIGEEMILRYDVAKEIFEKYGEKGLPVGMDVVTLVSGHGGGPGCHRTFNGEYNRDTRLFKISRDNDVSLVSKAQWWNEIAPMEYYSRLFK